MPDLTVEYVQVCASDSVSEQVVGSKGDRYDVLVSHNSELDQCTCPGFTFRRNCKHVTELRKKLCGWSAQCSEKTQTPQQEMEAICPECGGDTRTIRVGV